jgi:CheY-like chemotaxis protein
MNSPGGPRQKILVIEDEPDIARGLRDALEFEGFEVVLSGRGRDGIRALREQAPDLILLDLMLPDMNGFTVCEEIRKQNSVVPIIMLTARSEDTDKIRGLASGADDYVTKPFSVGELIARINAIFRRLRRAAPVDEVLILSLASGAGDQQRAPVAVVLRGGAVAPVGRAGRTARDARRNFGQDLGHVGRGLESLCRQHHREAAKKTGSRSGGPPTHRHDLRNRIQARGMKGAA